MTMNTERLEALIQRVIEKRKAEAEALSEAIKGAPMRHKEPNDEEFVVWFDQMAIANPNWVPALEYCRGGPEMVKRYINLAGQAAWQNLVEPYLALTEMQGV